MKTIPIRVTEVRRYEESEQKWIPIYDAIEKVAKHVLIEERRDIPVLIKDCWKTCEKRKWNRETGIILKQTVQFGKKCIKGCVNGHRNPARYYGVVHTEEGAKFYIFQHNALTIAERLTSVVMEELAHVFQKERGHGHSFMVQFIRLDRKYWELVEREMNKVCGNLNR